MIYSTRRIDQAKLKALKSNQVAEVRTNLWISSHGGSIFARIADSISLYDSTLISLAKRTILIIGLETFPTPPACRATTFGYPRFSCIGFFKLQNCSLSYARHITFTVTRNILIVAKHLHEINH